MLQPDFSGRIARALFLFASVASGALLATPTAAGLPNVTPSFAGISLHQQATDLSQTAWPPSPNAAVGPDHVVEVQNQSLAIFSREGSRLSHVRLRDFLRVVQGGVTYQATFDPRLLFDSHSQRWFMACISSGAGQTGKGDPVLLAVSRSADPTGTWTKFVLPLGEPPVGKDFRATSNLTLGLDEKGLYMGMRINPAQSAPFCKLVATPKASLLTARPRVGPLTQFSNLTGLVGSPQPALDFDAAPAGPGWVVASVEGANAGIRAWKISWRGNTPSLSGALSISTAAYGAPPDAEQNGSALLIEVGDDRLQSAVVRNGHLWTCRTVGVNNAGGSAGANRSGCEWLDLDLSSAIPTVAQTGREFDEGGSPRFYFNPTLSVNRQGDVVLSFNGVMSTEFIGAYYTGRLSTDPAGTMGPLQVLHAGEDTYERTVGQALLPFGRYGSVSIDPKDDFSFWSCQPYAHSAPPATGDSWGTWIARIQLSEPPIPPGVARVAPVKLSFGRVKVGRTRTKTFTITSRGANPLLGSVGDAAAPYSVVAGGGAYELARNRRWKVSVRFSPTVVGLSTSSLVVTTNDPAQPTVTLSLTGSGG